MRMHSFLQQAIQLGDKGCAVKEQSAANILVQNLKRDLNEIEALRKQVDIGHVAQFDKTIKDSQMKAQLAIKEYIST